MMYMIGCIGTEYSPLDKFLIMTIFRLFHQGNIQINFLELLTRQRMSAWSKSSDSLKKNMQRNLSFYLHKCLQFEEGHFHVTELPVNLFAQKIVFSFAVHHSNGPIA